MATISHDRARALLGVDRHAAPDDIRRAYRRRARRDHPDAGGDPDAFRELVEATELLLDRSEPPPPASPSTGRRAYPSTDGRFHAPGPRAAPEVDTTLLDDATAPATGAGWTVPGLAAAVVAAFADTADDGDPHRIAGASRRPGSFLNRFARHLSADLLARWEVTGATRRGVVGRDLEIVARFPPGARRHVDRATLPTGWSTTRNPGATTSTFVVRPGVDEAATAVLVAAALDEFCTAIGWPLADWFRVG